MIEITQTSSAAPERLWRYLGDVEHWGDHLPTFESVRRIGGPDPTAVGTRFEVRQPGVATAVYEITRWEPGRGFTWAGQVSGGTITAIHDIERAGDVNRIGLGIEWSGPLAWVARALMTGKARRMMRSEGKTIARLAEQD